MVQCVKAWPCRLTHDFPLLRPFFVTLQACGFPLYWKSILFSAAGGEKTGQLSYVAFSDFWRKMVTVFHDEAAQFLHILTYKSQRRNHIAPEDFVPLVQDVVDTHPGLEFLKEATEFHSRYVHTVSQFSKITLQRFTFWNQESFCWAGVMFKIVYLRSIRGRRKSNIGENFGTELQKNKGPTSILPRFP